MRHVDEMDNWRPTLSIRVSNIGLNWREGRLFAAEVTDDAGHIKGVRPLGGDVEFGETWQHALTREFREELGITATITSVPRVIENLFDHEGQKGHESVFAADATFPDGAFANQELVHFAEDRGANCTARWFDLDQLEEAGVSLYPPSLKALLRDRKA